MVYYDTGEPTTGTLSPKASEYQTEEEQEIYEEWKNLAVEHDTEKAEELLDEIGVVDKDDDWREMPNGDDLTLRIESDAEAEDAYMQTNELVEENWEEIGIETIINTVDPSELQVMVNDAEFDIRNSWEIGDGSNHLIFPQLEEDLPMGGFVNPWIVVYPAIVNPPTFWMDK